MNAVYLSLSSVLWCPLQFRMKSMFNSSLTPNCLYAGWYLICVHDLTIWVPWWVSYTKQELLTLPEHLGSPPVFDVVRDANLLIFCVLLISFFRTFKSGKQNIVIDLNKRERNAKRQLILDNTETRATLGAQDTKTNKWNKQNTENQKICITDHIKNWGWTQMFGECKQFLFRIRHPPWYSYS
jgi:hypothetical protein